MSTGNEAYVNPSFDPDGEQIAKNGGSYSNGIAKTDKNGLTKEEKYAKRKAEQAVKAQARRDREPLFFVKFITNHPKKAFAITLCGHIFFMVLTGVLLASGYDILPLEFTRFPLDLTDDVDYLRGLAWDQRNEDENHILNRGASEVAVTQQSQLLDVLSLLFYKEGGNVLTAENLKRIQTVENEFLETERFKNEFCLLGPNNQCQKPLSLIRFFDGTYAYASPVFNDPDFTNVTAVINEANRNPQTIQSLQRLIARTSVIEPDKVESWLTASFISMGYPLKGYDYVVENVNLDREDEQIQDAEAFVNDVIIPMGDNYFDDGVGDMDFTYGSLLYFNAWVFKQVFLDLALAGGSFITIGVFICIQTGSLWITGFALFGIFQSFTEANIIYRVILDYRYIGIFHVLSVFIVLGIGADDVFVFCDTWKETGQFKYKSLAHRLSDAYRRSALAMFFTSLTTAAAFIVSATSPFLVVSAFGVFSGLLIAVNYISIIVYLPCVVVMHHLYFEKYKCCCCCKSTSEDVTEMPDDGDHVVRNNFLVRFYSGPYFRFITHKIARWFVMVFFGALLGLFIYFATQLKVQEEQIKYVSTSVNLGQYLETINGQHFMASDHIRKIYIVFGLKPQDRSDCHKSDAACFGKTVWDEQFNMESPRVQQSFMDLCVALRNVEPDVIEELQIRTNPVTNKPEVECFAEYVRDFVDDEENRMVGGARRYPVGTDLTFPLDNDTVRTIMEHNPSIYNLSLLSDEWNSDLETVTSFWLYNGFQFNSNGALMSHSKFKTFDPDIGELKNAPTVVETQVGGINYLYGTKLKYVAIQVNTTIKDAGLGYVKGIPLRDKWEEVVSNEIKKLQPELQNGFQATPESTRFNLWHWVKVQEVLVWNAFLGVIIGLCVALPILIIATNNFVTGFLATFTLICVTVMVMGLLPPAGWKIGMLESLNMVLVVGLAVDYTVHFAEGYSRSAHSDRKGRTRDAITEVGISVTSGALTTCCSACFLLFAKIIFFQQFGIFMVSTLGFSLLWAVGFFTTALAIIGPQGDFGCITKLFASICCRNRNQDN